MDRNTLLAVTLCFLIFMGWQKFYIEPHTLQENAVRQSLVAQTTPPNVAGVAQGSTLNNSTVSSQSHHSASEPEQIQRPSVKLPVRTGTGDALLGDAGSFFVGWNLKSYKLGISPQAAAVDIQAVTNQPGQVSLAFDDKNFEYLNNVQGTLSSTPQGALWTYEDKNVKLTREYLTSDQQPYVDLRINAEFKSKRPNYAFISLASQGIEKDPEAQDRQLVYFSDQKINRILIDKDTIEQANSALPAKYIGATNRYFVMAVVAQSPMEAKALVQPLGPKSGRISLVYPVTGNTITIPTRVYFGPKEINLLKQVDPTLDHTVDFGWFTYFAYFLLKALKWLYQFVQNYGVAIILLTVGLKIATYPLTYKSMKSMKKMAKLQPQLQKLREKYKDDKEALNREMLTMMKTQGYNPMAGCAPMLIQMPVFFALYRVLYSSVELYHAPFALWIQDLSTKDPYFVTPVLLAGTMFFQQKLTPNTMTDPAQKRMMQLMPLIFGAMMISLPAGLTIYMLVNALASIVQQLILNKKLDAAPAR
jgi:YidC/Oxa1 family membrane protein insertase